MGALNIPFTELAKLHPATIELIGRVIAEGVSKWKAEIALYAPGGLCDRGYRLLEELEAKGLLKEGWLASTTDLEGVVRCAIQTTAGVELLLRSELVTFADLAVYLFWYEGKLAADVDAYRPDIWGGIFGMSQNQSYNRCAALITSWRYTPVEREADRKKWLSKAKASRSAHVRNKAKNS